MNFLRRELSRKPDAVAWMQGDAKHSDIGGRVSFYQTKQGVLVAASISGLPATHHSCKGPIFAFHIHNGERCSGTVDDPFGDAGTHYNPKSYSHPFHAGDMPPLFSNSGRALSVFLTDRFTVEDVVGKAVIIHSGTDDFITQPGGNAGSKIACGLIRSC